MNSSTSSPTASDLTMSNPPSLSTTIPPMIRNTSSPDSVADSRIDAIIQRFPWFANPDHQWSPSRSPPIPIQHYHLRRRPQIRCPACLNGELNQMAHMEAPNGCLYTNTLDTFHDVNQY
jgi:hypothetical protein